MQMVKQYKFNSILNKIADFNISIIGKNFKPNIEMQFSFWFDEQKICYLFPFKFYKFVLDTDNKDLDSPKSKKRQSSRLMIVGL